MTMQQSLKAIKAALDHAKRICLFGVGVLLDDCFDQLVLSIGREPDFLCDNDKGKWGVEFLGKKCISPAELGRLREDTAVIITVKSYEDIYQQLTRMGMKDVFVCCYDRCYNTLHAIKRLEDDRVGASTQEHLTVQVRGKWTLVTGATRGVGLQIALGMAKLGSNIIAHSRSISHAQEIVETGSALGVQVVPIAAELSNLTEVETMLSDLEHLVPRVDILFNNAAIPCSSGFWSASSEDYLGCFMVNTVAPIRICQRLIPPMIQRGFGRVINITSSVQKRPDVMAYACSKAALDKFVYDLTPSLRNTGVMVTLADPGWVRTDMTGFNAPHAVESVIPGALLGALLEGEINGHWFSVQDYSGLSIETALGKARFLSASLPEAKNTLDLKHGEVV